MNLASALLKQIILAQDSESWACLRKHYFPPEYYTVYSCIEKHVNKYHSLPSFDELQCSIRDANTVDQILAIKAVDVDVSVEKLVQYLKNEFVQREILNKLETYIDKSIAFEDYSETLEHLLNIVLEIEDKIEEDSIEATAKVDLFYEPEEIERFVPLGLNTDFDNQIKFAPDSLIMIGGRRGAGKSITCANIAVNMYESGKSALYFTIEMGTRPILQRCTAIGSEVVYSRLRSRNLLSEEWDRVADWWAGRFNDSEEVLKSYKSHRDFDEFHRNLVSSCSLPPERQLDIIYDSSLTIAKIQMELERRVKNNNIGIVIVDYINRVKRGNSKGSQYEWAEQIEISNSLKSMAQHFEVPIVAAYQIDASGEARFAKGILDPADASFIITPSDSQGDFMEFKCTKIRDAAMTNFTPVMNWHTLKIGPDTAIFEEETAAEPIDDLNDS